MIESPLVSIIIDNYNYGRFLSDSIESALNQTYKNTEIIVVDDGSTDSSSEIIKGYGSKVIPVLKENGGQGSAFNAGFKISKGNFIIFLDSDDLLLSTAAERAVEKFNSDKVVKVHWSLQKIYDYGRKSDEVLPERQLADGDYKEALIKFGPTACGGPPYSPPTSGNAWSRKYLEQVLPMPEKEFVQTADYFLTVLVPVYGEIRKIDEPLGLYRVHGANSTLRSTYLSNFIKRFEHCCLALSQHLQKTGVDIKLSDWPRNHWYHQIYYSIQEIEGIVPVNGSFILVDENNWGEGEVVLQRKKIPFVENKGEYWGTPKDDKQAIKEIERQRENGAAAIFFVATSFWFLDHFKGMHEHLKSSYECVVENQRLIGFDLTKRKKLTREFQEEPMKYI